MSIQDLRDYVSNKRSNLIESETQIVTFNSVDYPISSLFTTYLDEAYIDACRENAAGIRSVILPGSPNPVSMTNAQLITLISSARDLRQKIIDIYDAILTQVDALTLTTEGQIDSAWTTAFSVYTENRTTQPTNEALSSSITAASYTNEMAQDAIGSILSSEFVYDDAGNVISLRAKSFNYPTVGTGNQRVLGTAYQLSSTRDVFVSDAVDISSTLTLTGGATGTVIMEYADDSGFTANVKTVSSTANGNTGALTIGLSLTQVATASLGGIIPAGKYKRTRTVNTAGTPTFTYRSSQEVLL